MRQSKSISYNPQCQSHKHLQSALISLLNYFKSCEEISLIRMHNKIRNTEIISVKWFTTQHTKKLKFLHIFSQNCHIFSPPFDLATFLFKSQNHLTTTLKSRLSDILGMITYFTVIITDCGCWLPLVALRHNLGHSRWSSGSLNQRNCQTCKK